MNRDNVENILVTIDFLPSSRWNIIYSKTIQQNSNPFINHYMYTGYITSHHLFYHWTHRTNISNLGVRKKLTHNVLGHHFSSLGNLSLVMSFMPLFCLCTGLTIYISEYILSHYVMENSNLEGRENWSDIHLLQSPSLCLYILMENSNWFHYLCTKVWYKWHGVEGWKRWKFSVLLNKEADRTSPTHPHFMLLYIPAK